MHDAGDLEQSLAMDYMDTQGRMPLAMGHVLVVDDEETSCHLLKRMLEAKGHTITIARTGEEALIQVDKCLPDVVLLDVMMPGISGIEVCKRLKGDMRTARMPILMVTSLVGESDRIAGIEAGADDFISKPFNEQELALRVRNAIRVKRLFDRVCLDCDKLGEAGAKLKEMNRQLQRKSEQLQKYAQQLLAHNRQMEMELAIAHEIQRAFLPQKYPTIPRHVDAQDSALQFFHRYLPAESVGGDFFDVLDLSDTEVGVFISDVTGHGVGAALITAFLRGMVEELRPLAADPGAFLTEINRSMHSMLRQVGSEDIYATAFHLVADVRTGHARYANAGHPAPLHVRPASGQVESLADVKQDHGPILGLFEETRYHTCTRSIANSDVIMMFTDGLFEVEGDNHEFYGLHRLEQAVRARMNLSPSSMIDELLEEALSFSLDGKFSDDVCLLGMGVKRVGR